MTERDGDGSDAPRERTVAHMRQLMAAATALGVANAAMACTKPKDAPDAGDGKEFGPPDPPSAMTAPPVMNPVPDPALTAESTRDAATFAGPDAARARADAGAPKDPGRGYRVVDPLPRPTRINCNPPYTIDAKGKKKYKPDCIE